MLNPAELETLAAALDRIIPPDAWPGGAESLSYVTRLLAGDCHEQLPLYQAGMAALDRAALKAHDARFADLPAEFQDGILRLFENAREAAGIDPGAHRFFWLLVNHANEGFYADPGNGGNPRMASWEMTGFGAAERAATR